MIEHGRSGLLCVPEDVDCFVAEVARLAGDEQARNALGREARIASGAFRWDDAGESVLRAYRSLARISGRRVPA